MRHNLPESYRQAEWHKERAEATLRNKRVANDPRAAAHYMRMINDADAIIKRHHAEHGNPYHNDTTSTRNDRYNDRTNRRYSNTSDDRMAMVDDAMMLVDRILPHITGDMDDDYNVENRRGVFRSRPGHRVDRRKTSPYRGGRYRATANADYNDDADYSEGYNDAIEDMDSVENVRVRPYTRHKPGGGRVRVPGYTRRAPRMDDDWGDVDDVTRAAATAAAETARQIHNDRRNDVYPHYPIANPRHDADNRQDRTDRTSDTGAVGPGARR